MRKSLKETLMEIDHISEVEADHLIRKAKDEFQDLLTEGNTGDAYDICEIHFGLEPDYLEDLIEI